jgi:hypothetical protein
VMLLNTFTHVRRSQMPLEHLAAGQRATESRYPLVALRDVVSRTGLPAIGSTGTARPAAGCSPPPGHPLPRRRPAWPPAPAAPAPPPDP